MPALAPQLFTAAVTEEIDAVDLPVSGALPAQLTGDYIRNGPNPQPGSSAQHTFLGDGMLHGVRLEAGHARAYRNRWVRTRSFLGRTTYLRAFGRIDLTASVANTSIIAHAGKFLALVESSLPYEMTRTLETVGPYDFAGRLKTPFAAHPKRCPRSGELHAFGMSLPRGGLTYHRIDAGGTLVESRPVRIPRVTMMHDFAITDRFALFFDLPVVFDLTRAVRGVMPYRWDDAHPARIGVVPRDASGGPVRWFEIDPCYVFHFANAFETAQCITIDAIRYPDMWRNGATIGDGHLHRWTIDLMTGNVRETPLDDIKIEFPRCDERRTGTHHRYVYALSSEAGLGPALVKYDVRDGSCVNRRFGPGEMPAEFAFVPASAHSAEDAGWLLGFVYDAARDASNLLVLDASDITADAVATVALPVRVPFGFHGNWFPAAG